MTEQAPHDVIAEETPTLAIVVLTTGERNRALGELVESVRGHVLIEKVLVVNGGTAPRFEGWTHIDLPENIGVPAGRNVGIDHSSADVVMFIDDDAAIVTDDLSRQVTERFAAHPNLGALGFRVNVLGERESIRRWVPASERPGPDGLRSSVTFPGGAHALRREAVAAVGGYRDELFFKHEETELAWRLLDAGWNVAYDDQLLVEHPRTKEGRHPAALRVGARNKVWIARMALPQPLLVINVATTFVRYLGRCRTASNFGDVIAGVRQGLGDLPAPRQPMTWRTVWTLTRRGRPPIV